MTVSRSGYRMFRTAGPARNTDPKVALLRAATTAAENRYSSGGIRKAKHNVRPVTLPTLESARKLTRD